MPQYSESLSESSRVIIDQSHDRLLDCKELINTQEQIF